MTHIQQRLGSQQWSVRYAPHIRRFSRVESRGVFSLCVTCEAHTLQIHPQYVLINA